MRRALLKERLQLQLLAWLSNCSAQNSVVPNRSLSRAARRALLEEGLPLKLSFWLDLPDPSTGRSRPSSHGVQSVGRLIAPLLRRCTSGELNNAHFYILNWHKCTDVVAAVRWLMLCWLHHVPGCSAAALLQLCGVGVCVPASADITSWSPLAKRIRQTCNQRHSFVDSGLTLCASPS